MGNTLAKLSTIQINTTSWVSTVTSYSIDLNNFIRFVKTKIFLAQLHAVRLHSTTTAYTAKR